MIQDKNSKADGSTISLRIAPYHNMSYTTSRVSYLLRGKREDFGVNYEQWRKKKKHVFHGFLTLVLKFIEIHYESLCVSVPSCIILLRSVSTLINSYVVHTHELALNLPKDPVPKFYIWANSEWPEYFCSSIMIYELSVLPYQYVLTHVIFFRVKRKKSTH